MSEISVYKSPVKNVTPYKTVSLFDIYTVIRSDKYKAITERLRSFETKAERDYCKQTELDYATFSGSFKTRANDLLIKHSNYFCIDIDHISGEIDATKNNLLKSYIPALMFISPSGDGLKVVYKIDTTKGSHQDFYFAFEDYFKTEYNTDIDASCKDVSRACFLCHDSNCFYSENASVLGSDFINSHKTTVQGIVKTEYETGERPGDIYNQNPDSVYEMKSILQGAGWKQVGNYTWRRPNKDSGVSATLGKVAPNIFYVFTSNAHPFDPMKAYTPFQVLGLLKFNGDFKQAASSVAPGKPITYEQTKITISDIEKLLLNSRIDTSKTVEKPPTILSIKEQSGTSSVLKRLFTLGNFSCTIGKAKSRKTFVQSLLTAAILGEDRGGKLVSELPRGKKDVLYFDTEQGEYDCHNVIRRIERMAGDNKHLKAYSLRQYTPSERCMIIEYAFKLWGSSIAFCVIDGIADLATAINDEDEATRVVTMLLRLTKVHNCHISTVIHQNKNDNFATGWMGSSIMKKAEILISVSKCKDNKDASEVSCELSRGIDFDPFEIMINSEGIPEISGSVKPVKKHQPAFNEDEEELTVEQEYLNQFNREPNF